MLRPEANVRMDYQDRICTLSGTAGDPAASLSGLASSLVSRAAQVESGTDGVKLSGPPVLHSGRQS